MKVALYARVSTRNKGQHIDTQMSLLRSWSQTFGHEAIEFVDEASSVKWFERTAWKQLMTLVYEKQIEMVAITKLDRAFRSVVDMHEHVKIFQSTGIVLNCITQGLTTDVNTPVGKLIINIFGSFAEFERDIIQERVQEGVDRRRDEGKPVGRQKGAKDLRPRRKVGYLLRYEKLRERKTKRT